MVYYKYRSMARVNLLRMNVMRHMPFRRLLLLIRSLLHYQITPSRNLKNAKSQNLKISKWNLEPCYESQLCKGHSSANQTPGEPRQPENSITNAVEGKNMKIIYLFQRIWMAVLQRSKILIQPEAYLDFNSVCFLLKQFSFLMQ